MLRRIAPAAPALLLVMLGCAGPAKLAEKSEQMLAGGQNGRAWELAIRALDKDPGNTRARSAAAAAGNAMARDWDQMGFADARLRPVEPASPALPDENPA